MSDWSLIDRSHVTAAMAECDRLGSREFLSRYRFGRAKASSMWHGGQEYDVRAVLGYAMLVGTGRPANKDDFSGGESAAARLLTGLGFDVVVDEEAIEAEDRALAARALGDEDAAAAPPAARAATRTATVRKTATKRAAKVTVPKPVKQVARPNLMEAAAQVCPTCYMAMPKTGICDNCD